jgi:cell wall-associated NlpC family hydrolase
MQPADFIGIPFAEGGRDPAHGLDCWGLVWLAARELYGMELPSYHGDYMTPLDWDELNRLISGEKKIAWELIYAPKRAGNLQDVRDGDVALMSARGRDMHVGLVVNGGRNLLHVEAGTEAAAPPLDRLEIRSRLRPRDCGVYRWQG